MSAAPDGLSSAIGAPVMSDPTRYTLDGLCAVTASGQTAAALPRSMINSRRLMASPAPRTTSGIKSSITFWVEKRAVPYERPALMSALGQKRTSHQVRSTSALPPKADIGTQSRNVRFVPKAAVSNRSKKALFDHLVGAGEQRGRHSEAEGVGALEVDDQFELRGKLNRQVTRSGALEDFVDVRC